MSELEAATGEKKGGGDVSGVRDIFCFLRMIIDRYRFFLFSVHFSSGILKVFGALIMMHRIYCHRVYLFNPVPPFMAIVLLTQVFA